jgi:hypothetical protein
VPLRLTQTHEFDSHTQGNVQPEKPQGDYGDNTDANIFVQR